MRFNETLSIIDRGTGERDSPESHMRGPRWFGQYLAETLHLRLAHLFLAGLQDTQPVHTIKSTIPANELMFDSVVERHERRNMSEWGSAAPLKPDEADDLIRAPDATMKPR